MGISWWQELVNGTREVCKAYEFVVTGFAVLKDRVVRTLNGTRPVLRVDEIHTGRAHQDVVNVGGLRARPTPVVDVDGSQ